MNKTELIAAVAEASGKSKADVKDVLDALTAQIVKTVKAGDEISLVGFGTFKSAPEFYRRITDNFKRAFESQGFSSFLIFSLLW